MRALIQRVDQCEIWIDSVKYSSIGSGLLVLLGIEASDNQDDIDWLSGKIIRLRIFDDADRVMNLSVTDTGGEIMVVSQFTLFASTRKGNRPSYIRAASPNIAVPLYNSFVGAVQSLLGKPVVTGVFGAHMDLRIFNNGPVTIIIDTRLKE